METLIDKSKSYSPLFGGNSKMRKMVRVTLSSSFLIGSICFLILIFANNSLAQSRTRKTQAKKTQTIAKSSGSSAVILRFIKAMQDRDFKTVIDLTYSYQGEIERIKRQNPRVLWNKKIGEFYEQKITYLTEESSFWGDYTRASQAMWGEPTQNFRAVAYLLPQSCKWQVSETRNETLTSMYEGQYNQTTVYVTVDYPLNESTPIVNRNFLKQTMLKFGIRSGTQTVGNVYQVGEVNTFWSKPYPKSATAFLLSKYKNDILIGDKAAINELIEIAGWEVVEPFLLELVEQQSPYTEPFNVAIDALADNRVKKAVPIIIKALRGRNPMSISIPRGGYWVVPDINLVEALQKIGKSNFNEATQILKGRLSTIVTQTAWNNDWINKHLEALASVDDKSWSSFPYEFTGIVYEVNRKQKRAGVIDNNSPNVNKTITFLNSLKPCTDNEFFKCASNLTFTSVNIIDAKTVDVYGRIEEEKSAFNYHEVGKFRMVLTRKDGQLDKWLVQEISRTDNSTSIQNPASNSDNTNDNLSKEDTLQEFLKINKELNDAGLSGNKEIFEKYLAENFTYNDLTLGKTMDRAKYISKIKKNNNVISYKCYDEKLSFIGEAAFVRSTCDSVVKQLLVLVVDLRYAVLTKFVKKDEKWKVASMSFSVLPNR